MNNNRVDEHRKQLPMIVRNMNICMNETGNNSVVYSTMNSDMYTSNRYNNHSGVPDRSVSLRNTPKGSSKNSRSFNKDFNWSRNNKITLIGDLSKMINTKKDRLHNVSIKRNKTIVERLESPDLEIKGGAAKASLNDDLMYRGQLYQRIKNKPASTKAANREVIRIGKSMLQQTSEVKGKRKSKVIENLNLSHFNQRTIDHSLGAKKPSSTKSKTKSFESTQKQPQEKNSFMRNPASKTIQQNSISIPTTKKEGRVPYNLIPPLDPPKHSSSSFKYIKSYAVNTYKGLIREYNEDRVSIILNIVQPESKKHVHWPNCSFFAVE